MKRIFTYNLIVALLLSAGTTFSNGVTVTSTTLINQDATNKLISVRFNLSWNNSWRNTGGVTPPFNWDAVWVFIKFQSTCSPIWSHASIASAGHLATGGTTLNVPVDGRGAFVYRSTDGAGSVTANSMELRWDYGADGVDDPNLTEVQVIAIEMVYINGGDYYLGGDGGTFGSFTGLYDAGAGFGNAGLVTTAGFKYMTEINGMGPIGVSGNGLDTDIDGTPDNATFPTGHQAFYVMKYEVSQEQYAHFLSLISFNQASSRYLMGSANGRYQITTNGVTFSSSLPNVACGYINWFDALTYADWAGLRPMTECEFEKACRGPLAPVAGGEFAWGDGSIANAAYTLTNAGAPSETVVNSVAGAGNALYSDTGADLMRVGIFSASAQNPTRQETGASYYGVMELSGNAAELCADLFGGKYYDGSHGDGTISSSGQFNQPGWLSTLVLTGNSPMMIRGGSYLETQDRLVITDRVNAGAYYDDSFERFQYIGFRCARTAP